MRPGEMARELSGRVLLVAKAGEKIGRRWQHGEGEQTGRYVDIVAPADMRAEINIDADELWALALKACQNKSRRSRDGAITMKAVR